MTSHNLFIFVPILVIMIAAVLVLWGVTRRYRRDLGVAKDERERSTDTSFIISAFHEVTKQLKEKEKELERLKALAEQRAENSESYNRNILQCISNGVMTFDRDCRVTTMNRAAEDILGIAGDTAAGRTCSELFGVSSIVRAVSAALERNEPSARQEAMLERKNVARWLGYNTAVLTDRDRTAIGVILTFTDLTDVKRLQEQVELRERLTALGEMSAGVAHELRNPMAVISGYLALLAKRTEPAGQDLIRNISQEIEGMNRIIGDLLTFARPASLNRVPLSVRELLDACLDSVLQAKGVGSLISATVSGNDCTLLLDEVLMKQAFSNLIQNAIEALPGGGGISISVQSGTEVRITVSDSGPGIPADVLKKIFLPFYTTKDEGTGLGLALVHKIVTSHGGRVEAENRAGGGAVFTVILPAEVRAA